MAKCASFVKLLIVLGSLNAAAAVILGAFGAHVLKTTLDSQMFAVFSTGVQYHMYHALGILAVAMVASILHETVWLKVSAWAMVGGIVLFSGSLYVLSLSGIHWFGAITPIGGTLFIVSWTMIAISALKST
jgi:uncharacterized membrane protein YgdD (TMEM256/DUF423 family)